MIILPFGRPRVLSHMSHSLLRIWDHLISIISLMFFLLHQRFSFTANQDGCAAWWDISYRRRQVSAAVHLVGNSNHTLARLRVHSLQPAANRQEFWWEMTGGWTQRRTCLSLTLQPKGELMIPEQCPYPMMHSCGARRDGDPLPGVYSNCAHHAALLFS